jgi:hypothetical protein
MKFYRFKQVQRLVFFGYDDVLINDSGSLSKRSKQSTSGINDTKRLKFNFLGKNGVQLSSNARVVIESLYLPTSTGAGSGRLGPVTIRANNLQSDTYDTQDNNLNSPLLFVTETPGAFQNSHPEMLHNFKVSQQFFTNGYIELEITYPNVSIDLNDLVSFYISLIVYDVDEEELVLKDTPEVEPLQAHTPYNANSLGIVPKDPSRYSIKKK